MSLLKEKIKELIKKQLPVSTGNAKYRIGTVTRLNDNNQNIDASTRTGTCMVSLDGTSINAFPLYPVVLGQEVVLIFGDNRVSAIPTRPNTPQIEITPPPFFTGGKLRFVIDETQNIDPLTKVILRFQDQGSRNLYRFIVSDINGNNLGNVVCLSKDGKLLVVLTKDFGSANGDVWLKSFRLGSNLVSSGNIDKDNKIFSIAPSILQAIKPSINSTDNEEIVDCDIDDDGTVYYLRVRNTVSQTGLPSIPNQFTNSLWGFNDGTNSSVPFPLQGTALIHGGSALGWISSPFRVGLTGFDGRGSYSISSDQPWLSFDINTKVMTVDITGLGLANGQYVGNLSITSTFPPLPGSPGSGGTFHDVFEIYLFVGPLNRDEYTLFKVTKAKDATVSVVTPVASLATNLHLYNDNRFLIAGSGMCFINAKLNLVAGVNGDTGSFDVLDMGVGTTPVFSSHISGGESVVSKSESILSFLFVNVVGVASVLKVKFFKDRTFKLLPISNSIADLGLSGNGPNPTFLVSDSSGYIIDGNFVVRKLKVSEDGLSIAADENGIPNITPPINSTDTTTDTTKVRTIDSDTSGEFGVVFVVSSRFVT